MIIVLNIFGQYFDTKQQCSLINKELFENYIVYLREKTNANGNTVNSYLRGVRAMLNYFMELGYVQPFKIRLPKVDEEIKQGYSEYEIRILLDKPKRKRFTEIRNWAIINYLIRYGEQSIYRM